MQAHRRAAFERERLRALQHANGFVGGFGAPAPESSRSLGDRGQIERRIGAGECEHASGSGREHEGTLSPAASERRKI